MRREYPEASGQPPIKSLPRGVIPGRRWIEYAGQFGLLVFSVGLVSGAGLISAGKVLMGLTFVLCVPRMWRLLVRDRLFFLSLMFYAYLLIHVLVVAPPTADSVLRGGDPGDFLRVGFLTTVVAAFWWARLQQAGRFSWPIWGFVLGFHIRLLESWPLEDWSHGIPWKLGFGLYYNPFGMFCALVLTWWLVLLWRRADRKGPGELAAIACALLIPLLGLIYSTSRGAIVAFIAALLLMVSLWLRERADGSLSWKRLGAGAVALTVLTLVIVSGPVAQRDPQAKGEIGRILEQGIGHYVPQQASSIGTRVVVWREGVRLWLEKPMLGHGLGPTENFLLVLKNQYRLDDSFDFENTYLELLVRLGLVGTMFFVLHVGLCVHSLRQGIRARWYPPAPGRYLLLACVIFGGALFFREGLLDLRGRNFATFLLAGLYSFQAARIWAARKARDVEPV